MEVHGDESITGRRMKRLTDADEYPSDLGTTNSRKSHNSHNSHVRNAGQLEYSTEVLARSLYAGKTCVHFDVLVSDSYCQPRSADEASDIDRSIPSPRLFLPEGEKLT